MAQIILNSINISHALKKKGDFSHCWVQCSIYVKQVKFINCTIYIFYVPTKIFIFFLPQAIGIGPFKSPTLIMDLCIFFSVNLCFMFSNVIKLCYIHKSKVMILSWFIIYHLKCPCLSSLLDLKYNFSGIIYFQLGIHHTSSFILLLSIFVLYLRYVS